MARPSKVPNQSQEARRTLRPRMPKKQPPTPTPPRKRLRRSHPIKSQTRLPPKPTKTSIQQQDVVCDCIHNSPSGNEPFECERCQNLQDPDCSIDDSTGTSPRCNNCKRSEIHDHIIAQRQRIERLSRMVRQKRHEVQENFCADTLWKHYCNLPRGRASEAVVAITQTEYRHGAMVPVHPAPQTWIDEVQGRFAKMMRDSGGQGPSNLAAPSELSDLVRWRELAIRLLHHGPYKGRTAELGIITEVLGLEEKGSFWNGGWMGDFLNPFQQ